MTATAQEAPPLVADYQVKGRDLRQLYAPFCRRPLGDQAIWCLSLASSTLPDNHIGYQAWITDTADTDCHLAELREWCKGLAATAATLKPLLGKRRRLLVESYRQDWGDQAALDGLLLALKGKDAVPSLDSRADQFKCRWQAYGKIRGLVAGCVLMQMAQYEDALAWAVKVQRHG
jgi:hypothetical protein